MIDALVDVLAAYRLTRLAVDDQGSEVVRTRERVLRKVGPDHPVAELLGCPWCLSFWAGLGVFAARRAFPELWAPVAFGLAASAASGLLTTYEHSLEVA